MAKQDSISEKAPIRFRWTLSEAAELAKQHLVPRRMRKPVDRELQGELSIADNIVLSSD